MLVKIGDFFLSFKKPFKCLTCYVSVFSLSYTVAYIGISIVVGVLLIVFVIIAIIMVLFICYRKYKTKNTPRDNNMEDGIPMKNGHHPVGNGRKYTTCIMCVCAHVLDTS